MKTSVKFNKPAGSRPPTHDYIVIATTPDGVAHKFYQKATSPLRASMMVKSAHFPGQAVKAVVTQEAMA